jgi:MFS family permease
MSRVPFAIRALRHRNYRLFFGGQSLSLIGTWMTQVAASWLVYRLTNSALLLGLVSFSGQIPALLLTPFAGVWVDRWDRRRVLEVTQVLAMIQSLRDGGTGSERPRQHLAHPWTDDVSRRD